MPFSVPIEVDDVGSLPDNTELIENLSQAESITTVLPRFIGTEETGRFVTSFFVFKSQTLTLYTRRQADGQSGLGKSNSIELTNSPIVTGDLWNQTVILTGDDVAPVETLNQRSQYETYWLSFGHTPAVSFKEYAHEPFPTDVGGHPDCEHTKPEDPTYAPGLEIPITLCEDCGIPLAVGHNAQVYDARSTLEASFIGIPTDSGSPAKSTTTTPHGAITDKEVALHVLSRFAHAEQSHFGIYSRSERMGYLLIIGDVVAGYVLWNVFGENIALQQIYLLPHYRGEGLGELLVRSWFDSMEADHYFAIGVNKAGSGTIGNLGHFDDGIATPATILSCRDTLDAGEVNANYADQNRRGNDPFEGNGRD